MNLTDIIIVTNENYNIISIDWKNEQFKKIYKATWDTYINQNFKSIFDIETNIEDRILIWKDETFIYEQLNLMPNHIVILLKKEDYKNYLYEQTFNKIPSGIQIYDKNSCAVFFNDASKKISSISDDQYIKGNHLLDLYDLNEKFSTVLTALKTQAPVINRFDNFKQTKGTKITSVNTSYPIFHDKKLIGAMSFDRDISAINTEISNLENIKKVMLMEGISFRNKGIDNQYSFSSIIGKNKSFLEVVKLAKKISTQDCSVLIYGETGTGKELFAQSIHEHSLRKNNKFLAINCASVPETLIEGLLFGTTKGAFTGSIDRAGLLEEADGGTLFLDELNSMSLSMQSKILRVIQENVFRRIGGEKNINIDIRIISSCNENPYKIISENLLRKDLFYRLSTITIEIPPLRDRIDDIEILIQSCLSQYSLKYFKKIEYIDESVIKLLKSYKWPGNIRELFHIVEYALNVIEGNSWEISHLPKSFTNNFKENNKIYGNTNIDDDINILENDLQCIMEAYESKVIREILKYNNFNISKAATSMGIKRQSLQYRIKKHGIKI
jgi:arginine utilization regulatory protein